jgi:hypothetical protein
MPASAVANTFVDRVVRENEVYVERATGKIFKGVPESKEVEGKRAYFELTIMERRPQFKIRSDMKIMPVLCEPGYERLTDPTRILNALAYGEDVTL